MNLLKVKELPQGFVLKEEVILGMEGDNDVCNILGMVSPSLPLKLSFKNVSSYVETKDRFTFEILTYDTVKFAVEFNWKDEEIGVQKRYFHVCSAKASNLIITPCMPIGNRDATITFHQVQED